VWLIAEIEDGPTKGAPDLHRSLLFAEDSEDQNAHLRILIYLNSQFSVLNNNN